jgi:sugar O-acyltransferase (sialic acid O-acetyltransferase NeuD family)
MTCPVIILGSGGHAKVLIDTLLLLSVKILGATDTDTDKISKKMLGVDVIGDDQAVFNYAADQVELVNGLGSIAVTTRRKSLYNYFKEHGYRFSSIIHPSAVIASGANIAEGVQVMAGVVIQPGISIGENTIINTGAIVDHDCIIGSHVHLAPGVTLSGGVQVCEGVHIGTGATVIQGVRIGRGCIIGAGTLVLEDIPEGATAVGIPARVVKSEKL